MNEPPSPTHDRDVFEEVFALLTPERLLRDPRATGEGVTRLRHRQRRGA